jgi:hypothetical protein
MGIGKFQGVMAAQTPSGSRKVRVCFAWLAVSPPTCRRRRVMSKLAATAPTPRAGDRLPAFATERRALDACARSAIRRTTAGRDGAPPDALPVALVGDGYRAVDVGGGGAVSGRFRRGRVADDNPPAVPGAGASM